MPTRRKFIKDGSIALAGISAFSNSCSQKKYTANDTIRVAAIGMGIMGFKNVETALQIRGVELAAVCDLYKGRLERSKEVFGSHTITTQDYSELLNRSDIDAVIISTSDHWHDKISIEAMHAGKAVYCEKPMVHKIEEGLAVIETQNATGQIFQVGSQGVSSMMVSKARELYQKGEIGELVLIESWRDRQSYLGAWNYSIPTDASEQTVDWEGFIGDAPAIDFDPVRFFRWRNFQDYGTGVAGDLFVHLFSEIHAILESKGPERIYATGGLRYWNDGRDVPDVMLGSFDYPASENHPAFNLQLRVNFIDGKGGGSGTRLIGTEGVMDLGRNQITITYSKLSNRPRYGGWDSFETFSSSEQERFKKQFDDAFGSMEHIKQKSQYHYSEPEGADRHIMHHQNFYDAMRGESSIVEDAAFGLRAAAPSLAANKSYFEKKIIHWDPANMKLVN